MNIAITGSSGFVGSNLVKNNKNHNLTKIDLLSQKVGEINFTEIDTVVHLAALVHQMKGAPEDSYFKVNRDLTFEVAKRAKEQGVKHFLFMSTAKVYGESTTGKLPWNEDSNSDPQDAYGKSKLEAEKLIQSLKDDSFKVAIIRSPLIYGPGVKANMYNLIKLISKIPVLPLNIISNKRSFVYIENLIALILNIIENKSSGIFIGGDESSLSTGELSKLIAKKLNKRPIFFSFPDIILAVMKKIKPSIYERLYGSLELDNSTTNKKLNFHPPFSSSYGVEQMVKWYVNS